MQGKKTETKIMALLHNFNDAFKNHDTKELLSMFASSKHVAFIGSEIVEQAMTQEELENLIKRLFSRHATYTWEWKRCVIDATRVMAWLSAEAEIIARYDDGREERGPYRISGVFRKMHDDWKWVHFHGSEPMEVDE